LKKAGEKPLARWTTHDLRRSCATGMGNLGVDPHVIEAVLGHVSGFRAGVAGVYNRSDYLAQMRAALDEWGKHLTALTKPRAVGGKAEAVA
jgi:integrase